MSAANHSSLRVRRFGQRILPDCVPSTVYHFLSSLAKSWTDRPKWLRENHDDQSHHWLAEHHLWIVLVRRSIDLTGWQPHRIARAGLARTFQVVRLFKDFTVRENVEVAAIAATA